MEQNEIKLGMVEPDVVKPYIEVEEFENDELKRCYLKALVGSETMFTRLGEFLACLVGSDGFYYEHSYGEDKKSYFVDMKSKDEELAEDNKEDMGEDTGADDTVENKF